MSGIAQVTQGGPKTFIPADNEVIVGGRLVEARAGGRIGIAAAGSVVVLGAALHDAVAPEDFPPANGTDPLGRPVVSAVKISTTVSVAYAGAEVKLEYSAAATFGQKLVCTGSGKVGPAAATPDARTIVGTCTEPAGVAANATGLTRLA